MKRGIWLFGNWKMNHGPAAAQQFFSEWKQLKQQPLPATLQVTLFTPAISLAEARTAAQTCDPALRIGAQNAHWEKSGAFTGELSGPLLQEIGIRDVLIGHSERRQFFGETNATVCKRTESLLEQGFRVTVCVGESRAEREAGKTREVLLEQLGALFSSGTGTGNVCSRFLDQRLIIAYEPVWAIGTGLTATPAQAQEAHSWIRAFLVEKCGQKSAESTPILYGGSVNPGNIETLLNLPDIDGALVGGASLKSQDWNSLVQSSQRVLS